MSGNSNIAERIEAQAQLDERYLNVIEELLAAGPNPPDQAGTVTQAISGAT